MIVVFYVVTLLVVLALLGYSLFIAAPVVWDLALELWQWWTMLPVIDEIVGPIVALLGEPGFVATVAPLWDPWLAAITAALAVLGLAAAVRYLPRYISGDL